MNKTASIISILALCSLCFFGGRVSKKCDCVSPISDTIYIERTDTLCITDYDTIVEKQIGYKYISVHDTIKVDSIVYMQLPITQRWYHEDSLCDVWVSGYEPNLDSLHIVQRHATEIIRETKVYYKMPRLTAEIGCGALYLPNRLVGSVCAEVRYNAPKMSYSAFGCYTTDKKAVVGASVGLRFNLVK